MNRIIGKILITPAGSKIRGKRPHSAQQSKGSTDQWTGARNTTYAVMAAGLMGVPVAISIPIFIAQLEKSQTGYYQAIVRAGYAAVAKELETDPSHTGNYSYTYSVADAAVTADTTAATATAEGGIGDWTVDTEIDSSKNKAGDKQATSWEIVFDKGRKYHGATVMSVK